jgi:hypothetical protein
MKLIRVMEGLYRSECGGIRVAKEAWNKDLPWVVCWTDFLSARHENRFKTLAECRAYLAGK